jgi:hypothetical protein
MLIGLICTATAFYPGSVRAVEFIPLNESDLDRLAVNLEEIKVIAPKLRIQLRKIRSQVVFDVRQVHAIEHAISPVERDLVGMGAMHKGQRINELRAHFLADDLRRKTKSLHTGEKYVTAMYDQLLEDPDPRKAVLLEQYEQLLSDYNRLLDQCLSIAITNRDAS